VVLDQPEGVRAVTDGRFDEVAVAEHKALAAVPLSTPEHAEALTGRAPRASAARAAVLRRPAVRRPDRRRTQGRHSPPADLPQTAAAERVTVLSQVPSSFKYVVRTYEHSAAELALPYIVFGGEALDRSSVRRWLELRPGAEKLINMYGITETTMHVTYRHVLPGDVSGTLIGRPLGQLLVELLDERQAVVPPGGTGEMYVRGTSLPRGYLGRPDLTEERFPTLSVGGGAVVPHGRSRLLSAEALPVHMVLNRIVVVPELPLTPSGKLDRAVREAGQRGVPG
jgi:non-ribosomal peptide synthetase component F